MNNEDIPGKRPELTLAEQELDSISRSQAEQLAKRHENIELHNPENTTEVTKEALEQARSVETDKQAELESPTETSKPADRLGHLGRKQAAEISFKQTMNQIQSDMSAPSRVFSKVIHNKVIEKTSETLGSTIARPNALLAGSVFAFLITLSVYLVAKNLGYPLSGFETIAAFLLGWVLGLVFDFLRTMITGKRG